MNTTIPTKRGCGTRRPGMLYMSVGVGGSLSIFDLLIDPPIPYDGQPWRGIVRDDDILGPDGSIVLRDMISKKDYPSVASYVEEARRFGISRAISSQTDFGEWADKDIYIALVHWRARCKFDHPKRFTLCHWLKYLECKYRGDNEHYPDCLYHSWGTAQFVHPRRKVSKDDGSICIEMPSFSFRPHTMIDNYNRDAMLEKFPKPVKMLPGVFMFFRPTHIEAVQYVPDGVRPDESGLPVIVMEE